MIPETILTTRRGGPLKRLLTALAASCTVATVLLLASTPAADALTQRGHTFAFAFGAPGTREGLFLEPSAIALSDATGHVYVADRGNDRVEVFEPESNSSGEVVGERFLSQFAVPYPEAIAVDNSTGGPSSGDVYVVGTTAEEAKELHASSPELGRHDALVYKFDAEGETIATLSAYRSPEVQAEVKACEEEGKTAKECDEAHGGEGLGVIEGIAVDLSGKLLVHQRGGGVETFDDAVVNQGESSVQSQAREVPGFAVDAEGDLYAGARIQSGVLESGGQFGGLEEEEAAQHSLEDEQDGLPEGTFAFVVKLEHNTGDVLSPGLDLEDTTAVAVNPNDVPGNEVDELNDAYIANLAFPGGQEATAIAAFAPDGTLIQRFGAPGLKEGDGVALDSQTGAVYVADTVSDKVDVFELEAPGRPQVDGLSEIPNPTKLQAQINPSGSDTRYDFEYGMGSCAVSSNCTATSEVDIGAGFGDQQASAQLPSLPAGLYHYRVVARSTFGTVRSAEQTFSVLAPTGELLDGRAWEMVSPPNKAGAEPEAITHEGGLIQASEDGNAISYVADGPMPAEVQPEGSRSPEVAQILSSRGPQGWSSQDITTPNTRGSGLSQGKAPEYQFFSRNLALALVKPFYEEPQSGSMEKPPLSPPLSPKEEGHQQKTIFLRDDSPLQPEAAEALSYEAAKHNGELMKPENPGYLALVTELNAPGGEEFGGSGKHKGLEFLGATPDLSHVVFSSDKAAPGIYEWGPDGALHAVSVLPDNTRETSGTAGEEQVFARHAISNDGNHIVWKSQVNDHLYVRDTATEETLQLDSVQPGASGQGSDEPGFQAASADGSRVFFTDEQRLTADSKALSGAPDLYVVELDAPGRPLSGALTDLTPAGLNGESADVLAHSGFGGVLGASEDGSDVYFGANGALTPGANRGNCSKTTEPRPAGTTCSLYVRHYNGTGWAPPKLIATVSNGDSPDWKAEDRALGEMTARVSPNGEYLAFMSDRSLTGYDNSDATSAGEAQGAHDEEVYLYDASNERLVCASCNPTGARPKGVFDEGSGPGNTEGIGLLVDHRLTWSPGIDAAADHWLAGSVPGWTGLEVNGVSLYQSRYLSDNGRLFFNSPDRLVSAATSTKEKVYEYEPNNLGNCHSTAGCVGLISSGGAEHESAFLDASASGNDVFFLTAEPLARQDIDSGFDIYDAHVCEASSPCPTPTLAPPSPCQETAELPCKGSVPSATLFGTPGSTGPLGAGNVVQRPGMAGPESGKAKPKPLTRAQKLIRALKACKLRKPKKKRLACETQAHKKYGPKKHTKAKNGATTRRGA
jgi:DNA-binding beta-propeller fold protein YncE